MRPERERADHSDRGLDLERLWKELDEDAPGPVRSLPRLATKVGRAPKRTRRSQRAT
jgi:hypothetical protein